MVTPYTYQFVFKFFWYFIEFLYLQKHWYFVSDGEVKCKFYMLLFIEFMWRYLKMNEHTLIWMHFALFYSYFGDKGEPIEKIP